MVQLWAKLSILFKPTTLNLPIANFNGFSSLDSAYIQTPSSTSMSLNEVSSSPVEPAVDQTSTVNLSDEALNSMVEGWDIYGNTSNFAPRATNTRYTYTLRFNVHELWNLYIPQWLWILPSKGKINSFRFGLRTHINRSHIQK